MKYGSCFQVRQEAEPRVQEVCGPDHKSDSPTFKNSLSFGECTHGTNSLITGYIQ